MKLSESEIKALTILKANGMVPVSRLLDKTIYNCFGDVELPGMRIFKKLEKAGLCIIQNEEDSGEWESYVFLTDMGEFCLIENGASL